MAIPCEVIENNYKNWKSFVLNRITIYWASETSKVPTFGKKRLNLNVRNMGLSIGFNKQIRKKTKPDVVRFTWFEIPWIYDLTYYDILIPHLTLGPMVKKLWNRLIYLGMELTHIQTPANPGSFKNSLDFIMCFPRIMFIKIEEKKLSCVKMLIIYCSWL